MPYDEKLAQDMRKFLSKMKGISEKKMFGGICFFLNGNMYCGVEVGRYMFRVGKQLESEAVSRGAEVVAFNGRRMGGLVWVDEALSRGKDIQPWLKLAKQFVSTLPAK